MFQHHILSQPTSALQKIQLTFLYVCPGASFAKNCHIPTQWLSENRSCTRCAWTPSFLYLPHNTVQLNKPCRTLKNLDYSIFVSFLLCLHKYSAICTGLSLCIKFFKIDLKHWSLLKLFLNAVIFYIVVRNLNFFRLYNWNGRIFLIHQNRRQYDSSLLQVSGSV
jgi:hypothetical protein